MNHHARRSWFKDYDAFRQRRSMLDRHRNTPFMLSAHDAAKLTSLLRTVPGIWTTLMQNAGVPRALGGPHICIDITREAPHGAWRVEWNASTRSAFASVSTMHGLRTPVVVRMCCYTTGRYSSVHGALLVLTPRLIIHLCAAADRAHGVAFVSCLVPLLRTLYRRPPHVVSTACFNPSSYHPLQTRADRWCLLWSTAACMCVLRTIARQHDASVLRVLSRIQYMSENRVRLGTWFGSLSASCVPGVRAHVANEHKDTGTPPNKNPSGSQACNALPVSWVMHPRTSQECIVWEA